MIARWKEATRKSSLNQLATRASDHPSEGLMIASEAGKTVKYAMGRYLAYQKNRAIDIISIFDQTLEHRAI